MARFGGNEFTTFSVPLVFKGRYFVLEPGDPPLLSVFLEVGGQPVFEVLKNKPVVNAITEVTSSGAGVVTVSDRQSYRFLYKVRPGSETSVAFGKLDGGEISAQITDRMIQVGGMKLENNTFAGAMAGVVVEENGSVGMGCALPQAVVRLLSPR